MGNHLEMEIIEYDDIIKTIVAYFVIIILYFFHIFFVCHIYLFIFIPFENQNRYLYASIHAYPPNPLGIFIDKKMSKDVSSHLPFFMINYFIFTHIDKVFLKKI